VWCKVFDDRLAQVVLASLLLYSTNSITCGLGVLLIYKLQVLKCMSATSSLVLVNTTLQCDDSQQGLHSALLAHIHV
jgi:hypothetical protein